MSSSKPLLSIIIPTHERANLLERCLKSIRNQTFIDYELIIISDVKDVDTALVAYKYLGESDIFIKRNGLLGPAESRNVGLRNISGEWIIFLDDDDAFVKNHLENLANTIKITNASILYCDARLIVEDRSLDIIDEISSTNIALSNADVQTVWIKNFIPNNCLTYRASHIQELCFDPDLSSLEDWDFLLSACQSTIPVYYDSDTAIFYKDYNNKGNRRGTSESATNSQVITDYLRIYKNRPAPNTELKTARRDFLLSAGINVEIDDL